MKHVGEAISSTSLDPDNKIVVLGIANWTTVSNNHDLLKKKVINFLRFKRLCQQNKIPRTWNLGLIMAKIFDFYCKNRPKLPNEMKFVILGKNVFS